MCNENNQNADEEQYFRDRARTIYADDTDDVRIDDNALVDIVAPEEHGAWVRGWFWVYDERDDETDDE